MSRFVLGNCIDVMTRIPDNAIDFILTDPPYLVGFRDRSGRTIAGDKTDEWLQPACNEMYRVLKKDALMVSFYGWNRVDRFMAAWKNAGFSVVGHLVFTKNYTSKAAYVGYRHECAYILAKGRPRLPQNPLPDVLGWKYSGNRHHPTEKPVICARARRSTSKVSFAPVAGRITVSPVTSPKFLLRPRAPCRCWDVPQVLRLSRKRGNSSAVSISRNHRRRPVRKKEAQKRKAVDVRPRSRSRSRNRRRVTITGFQMISRSERLTVTTAPSCAGHHRRYEDERIFQNTSGTA